MKAKHVVIGLLVLWVVVGEFQAQKIDSLAGIKTTECLSRDKVSLAVGLVAMSMDPLSQMYLKARNSVVKASCN